MGRRPKIETRTTDPRNMTVDEVERRKRRVVEMMAAAVAQCCEDGIDVKDACMIGAACLIAGLRDEIGILQAQKFLAELRLALSQGPILGPGLDRLPIRGTA